LELDHDEALPPGAAEHLRACARCRRLAESIRGTESRLSAEGPVEVELVDSVMARIAAADRPPHRRPLLGGWFVGGLLLAVGMVAVRQSPTFRYLLAGVLGARVDLAVTTAIAVGLVGYLAAFALTRARKDSPSEP
jgi:predicted anti-sigma-YlaC factor YlaD